VAAVLRVGVSQDEVTRVLERFEYFEILDPIFGLVGLVLAVGLLSQRRWAWVGTMIWAGLNMAIGLVAFHHGTPHYISMALSVVAVFYLNLREVQVAFLGHSLRYERPGPRG
jgi:hypothetical protein